MSYNLITVQTFLVATQAHLAKNLLEEAGIRCYLKNDAIAAMDWRMTQALGGIKLQVADVNFDRAKAILESRPPLPDEAEELAEKNNSTEKPYWMGSEADNEFAPVPANSWEDEDSPEESIEAEVIPDDEEGDEYPEDSPLDELAVRAFRAAVIGLIFFPLQLYVTYLLVLMLNTSGKLAPSNRWKVVVAFLINFGMIWILKMIVQMILRGPQHPEQFI